MAEGESKKKTRPVQVSDAAIMKAIVKYKGNVTSIAKSCGISRQAVHKRIEASEELKSAKAEQIEIVLDHCECKAWELAMAGDPRMLALLLTTIGRKRGYTKTLDVQGSINNTGTVHILELPDNGRKRSNDKA